MPFCGPEASAAGSDHGSGFAHIKWHTKRNSDIRCSLVLQVDGGPAEGSEAPKYPRVWVLLPGDSTETIHDSRCVSVHVNKSSNLVIKIWPLVLEERTSLER